jgi:poly-gamma-glutamate capsule biosynthesis protein CapA/YwtB (metallophosphatase superfamily)
MSSSNLPGIHAPEENSQEGAATASVGEAPTSEPAPQATPTPLPDRLRLGVEARWVSAAGPALASLDLPVEVILQPLDPSPELLQAGTVDFLLVPDTEGVPVTERALALAVPWASEWEQVTLEEAQTLVREESAFIAQIEWPEMTPALKPLKISGLHPSQPGYPLKSSWSLHARPGLEDFAAQIASALSDAMIDRAVKLTAVGDIMLARGIGERIQNGVDPYPFAAIEHLLADSDLTIGNLESALGDGGKPEEKGYTFLAPPSAAEVLGDAGFDVLSLANNHAMDFGPQTLLQGIGLLEEQGINTVGAGIDIARAIEPVRLDLANGTNAILAYVDVPVEVRGFDTRSWLASETKPGVAWADLNMMRAGIERAREYADFIIVLLHSGYEYVSPPSPPQQLAARLAVDSGADLVIGHHSHVLQGVEFYNKGIILYGLGNFAFEDGGVAESGLMNIWIDAQGIRSLEFIPIMLAPDGRPIPADPLQSAAIRGDLYRLSRTIIP